MTQFEAFCELSSRKVSPTAKIRTINTKDVICPSEAAAFIKIWLNIDQKKDYICSTLKYLKVALSTADTHIWKPCVEYFSA